jgi:hypothetical protein
MNNRFNRGQKRRGSPSGNESDKPKRFKAYPIEGSLPKIGDSPSSESMRGLKLYLVAEAGKIAGMHHLQLFDYSEIESKRLVDSLCQEDMMNPYSLAASYSRNSTSDEDNKKMQGKINDWEVNIIVKRGEVKKKLKEDHLNIQQKLIAIILGVMTGVMRETILRWVSENRTNLENPHFQGVYYLVEHLFIITGVASSDLYNSTKRELLAMEFKDDGSLTVTMFYNKLLGKIEELNNQASKDSEKITTNAAILELIFNAYCKSMILKESVSKTRNAWAEVERDVKAMGIGITTIEEFERIHMLHNTTYPLIEYKVEDLDVTLRGRLDTGGLRAAINISPRSSISSRSIQTSIAPGIPSRFSERDTEGLNAADREAIAIVESAAKDSQVHNLIVMGSAVATANSSSTLNLTQKSNATSVALNVQQAADTLDNVNMLAEIAKIKATAETTAAQEVSTLEEEALGVEYMRKKEQLISLTNTAKLEVLLPMTVMPVSMTLADRENVMLASTNAVKGLDLKLVNDLSLLKSSREAVIKAAREVEHRTSLMEPLQRQISDLQMKVDEQTKASAQATKLMLVQLQVDAIKKALLKLTPTNIINDFQQFFIRMKKSTTAYCNQCRTSSHNTSECRSKKEHREQALLAGARAKEVQKYGAAKSAKVLAEKKTAYLKTVECHNCHKLGHYKNQCPMQEKSSKGILGGAVVGKE